MTKQSLIDQIENSEITESQAKAILDILNMGAPKAIFDLGITMEMQEARKTESNAIIDTATFAKLQMTVDQMRTALHS